MNTRPSNTKPWNDINKYKCINSMNYIEIQLIYGYSIAAQAIAKRSFLNIDTIEGTNKLANAYPK